MLKILAIGANRKIFCSISKNNNNGFFNNIRNKGKDLQTKIYQCQRKIASFIKKHRTIKLLHLFRKYSALAVVVSSAVLVTATNLAAEGESGSFLAGQWKGEKNENEVKKDIATQAEKERGNSLTPAFVASRAVNPNFKEEENNEIISGAEGKIVAAPSSPVLKDPQEGDGLTVYAVKSGDTVGSIAEAYDITINTILWANDIDDVDSIMPGDKIFILPVAGLTHIVKSGETINNIAKEYEAKKEKIISFNDLPADGEIKEGQEIIIPGGIKEIPQFVEETLIVRRNYVTSEGGSPDISGFKKLDGKAGSGHSFPYGYCTWYVAQKRYVPWGGNAGTWLYNAKARGYKTGKTPKKGSILVTSESWWGHVAIVEKVSKGTITISEMNFKGWGKTSKRTISTKNRVIKGYIY